MEHINLYIKDGQLITKNKPVDINIINKVTNINEPLDLSIKKKDLSNEPLDLSINKDNVQVTKRSVGRPRKGIEPCAKYDKKAQIIMSSRRYRYKNSIKTQEKLLEMLINENEKIKKINSSLEIAKNNILKLLYNQK